MAILTEHHQEMVSVGIHLPQLLHGRLLLHLWVTLGNARQLFLRVIAKHQTLDLEHPLEHRLLPCLPLLALPCFHYHCRHPTAEEAHCAGLLLNGCLAVVALNGLNVDSLQLDVFLRGKLHQLLYLFVEEHLLRHKLNQHKLSDFVCYFHLFAVLVKELLIELLLSLRVILVLGLLVLVLIVIADY